MHNCVTGRLDMISCADFMHTAYWEGVRHTIEIALGFSFGLATLCVVWWYRDRKPKPVKVGAK